MINTIEELLKELDEQLEYLSHSTKVPGMQACDVKQELIVIILQDYSKYSDFEKYSIGWWYKRLKWSLQNIIEKSSREPINRATRIDNIE